MNVNKRPFGTQCPDPLTIETIGRLELAKRERGMSEEEMYYLEKAVKNSEQRVKMASESTEGFTEGDFEQLYQDLKYRRKLFKELKKDGRKYQKELKEKPDKSEENSQITEVNQNIKEEDQ